MIIVQLKQKAVKQNMDTGRVNFLITLQFNWVQFNRSVMSDSLWPHELQHARPPCLSSTPESTQTHVHRVSNAIQPSHPLSSPSPPPSIFPSIRVFSNESVLLIRWPKYWSFSYSISPSNEYSGLISFRMDWLDLLAVQGTLKSLLQHHNAKASVLWCSVFFLYGSVQSIHDFWKKYSFDYTGLWWQSDISAF